MSVRDVLYRLLFTKDDDMDLTQILFVSNVVFFWLAFGLAGFGVWAVSTAAWSVFGAVFATLAIAGTSHVVSKRLADRNSSGAPNLTVSPNSSEPNVYTDDERGDYTERERLS